MTEWANGERHTIAESDIATTHVAPQEKFDRKMVDGMEQINDGHCRW